MTKLYALGEIARMLGQLEHRIRYVIESRGIEAFGIAGHVKVYSAEDVGRIKSEIERIDARKGGAL